MRTGWAHKVREPKGVAREIESLLVMHAAELLTLQGPTRPRTRHEAARLAIIEDGAVFAKGDRIADVGPTDDVLRRHPRATHTIDATGKVVLPGFVDPHTHAVFAGSREHEVEWKAQGLSYPEIAARGGGILHTVRATREAPEEVLALLAGQRLQAMRRLGTTTAEIKSGYGLRTADEIKILRAAFRAGERAGVDIATTFLGAHAVPPEFETRADAYADSLVEESLPAVSSSGLATFCDVFVERGYFDVAQARRIFEKAVALGLRPKVHADELSECGGATLAAQVRAVSADHLLHTSTEGIEAMALAGVIGVLLPATSLSSRLPYADGRRLVEAGVPVALATDFSPNSWCESMQFVIALACHHNGLTPAQAIVAATINAAHAIGRGNRIGSLEIGKQADLLVTDVPSHGHLGYRLAANVVETVVRRGRVVAVTGR